LFVLLRRAIFRAAALCRRSFAVTHVVTEACIRCRYTDCVDVCPVDCFHAGPNMLVIDPDAEEDLPADQQAFTALNAELTGVFPVLTKREEPLPDADAWKDVTDKLALLER
jgi:ferredoxin